MRLLITITTLFLTSFGWAQLLDSTALAEAKVYTSLDAAMANPAEVYRLDLSRSKLAELPETIGQLQNLNELKLTKNKLEQLPEAITRLPHLQILEIDKNKFEYFPAQVCRLKNLRVLNISQNMIVGFPACIGNLRKLEYLDAWSNDLGVFPQEMRNLTSLREMDLRVISLSTDEMITIASYLPNTDIHFSNGCSCGYGH